MNITSYKPVKVDGVPQLRYQCPACDKAQVTPLVNAGKPRTCDQCLAESVLPSIEAIKEKFPPVVPAPPPPKATIEQILAPKHVKYIGDDGPPNPMLEVEAKLSLLRKEVETSNEHLRAISSNLTVIGIVVVCWACLNVVGCLVTVARISAAVSR